MTKQIDFLTPNTEQIRHQIRNIIESYNHDWDVIAELAQNSVDAIRKEEPVKGHIWLEIDAPQKRILFRDNGCGISPDALPHLMAPFSSDKTQDPSLIGYKGVGISFVIFSSIRFEIETHHDGGSIRSVVEGASAWVNAHTNELPTLSVEPIDPTPAHGTKIELWLPDENEFFRLTFNQLKMVLRTRTAVGDTCTIWGDKPDKDVLLTFRDLNGNTHSQQIDCSYHLPTADLKRGEYLSLREFQQWNIQDRTDAQKRRKLSNRVIYLDGQQERAGRRIHYWACFVPKRKVWDTLSVRSGLADKDILTLHPSDRTQQYVDAEHLFSGGMYTSTKGMPTGIRSAMRARGSAGYLPNFFIVVDDPQLSFDIGRKSIPGRQLGMLRDVASDVFRDFINTIKKYIGGEPDYIDDGWDRTAAFNEVREMPNLDSAKTLFLKRPKGQEATVAAIFFELLGKGTITGFVPYISGYKNKYDLYARYKKSDVVVEFKYALHSLFRDFDDEKKLFDEIDVVVVWEVTEKDHEIVAGRGLDLQRVEMGITGNGDRVFEYQLILGPTRPIHIICLSERI